MFRFFIALSIVGAVLAATLHFVALSGSVPGGEVPLYFLFALMFLCFGSAVIVKSVRDAKNKKMKVEARIPIPPLLRWGSEAVFSYGIVILFLHGGGVRHNLGDAFPPQMASTFYATQLSFFAIAIRFHFENLKAEELNQFLDPTLASGTPPAGQEARHRWRGSRQRSTNHDRARNPN
jgi:hypothetical protein